MNRPERIETQPEVITADCRKVSGADFWRQMNAERYFRREQDAAVKAAIHQAIADGDIETHAALLRQCIDRQIERMGG